MFEGQPIERLRQTFGVVDNRTVTISVLAETGNETRDAKQIVTLFNALQKQYNGTISETRYFFGAPEVEEEAAKARWVHDMDLAVTSDLLVLSGGSFSSLAAAMQLKKRAFTLTSKEFDIIDYPGMIRGMQEKDGSIRIAERAFLRPVFTE